MLFYVIGWYLMHCMFLANLLVVSYDVYINAQMVIIMLNEILLGLLLNITDQLMILLILMKLIVVNSLHRDYMVLNGDEWSWTGYPTIHCDVMYAVMDVFMGINDV